jgi:hypothetical protein
MGLPPMSLYYISFRKNPLSASNEKLQASIEYCNLTGINFSLEKIIDNAVLFLSLSNIITSLKLVVKIKQKCFRNFTRITNFHLILK